MAQYPFDEITNDLPENWQVNDIVSPDGESVNLSEQHGYNYLMRKVNEIGGKTNILREEDKTNKESIEDINTEINNIKDTGVQVADTLPIGSVIHWDSEEPYPSDIYEEVTYNPRQLLVNPDFQINQRGQSEYNFSKNGNYGLDMWQHRQGNYTGALVVTPIKGGGVHIKLDTNVGGGLRQVFKTDELKAGQQYTTVISIDNVEYTGTIELSNSSKIIDNDLFQLEFAIADDIVNYSLWIKQNGFEGDINYCNLWEGDIAYPHVKEDEAIALMRCMEYVERLKFAVTCTGSYFISGSTYMFPKKELPTIRFLSVKNQDGDLTTSDFSTTNYDKYFLNFIRYKNGSAATLSAQTLSFEVLISCEPL